MTPQQQIEELKTANGILKSTIEAQQYFSTAMNFACFSLGILVAIVGWIIYNFAINKIQEKKENK